MSKLAESALPGIYQAEKRSLHLKEMGDKIDADTKAKVEAAVARVREALSKDDAEEMKSATEALTQVWHEAASKIYSAASSGASQGPGDKAETKAEEKGGKREDKGDGAVDADFEVVD